MQDTIENYMRDINKIPELLEVKSQPFIEKFSAQFLSELKEYIIKNKMIYCEEEIKNCIFENLKLSNEKNKKENEEFFVEYQQFFPKKFIVDIPLFIHKYEEYLSNKIDSLAFSESYFKTPTMLKKEILKIIERENYHNVFLISNHEKVKIFVYFLIGKHYQKYVEQIKLVSYQFVYKNFRDKSEILKKTLISNINDSPYIDKSTLNKK